MPGNDSDSFDLAMLGSDLTPQMFVRETRTLNSPFDLPVPVWVFLEKMYPCLAPNRRGGVSMWSLIIYRKTSAIKYDLFHTGLVKKRCQIVICGIYLNSTFFGVSTRQTGFVFDV